MAVSRISALTAIASGILAGGDEFGVEDASATTSTLKVTWAQIKTQLLLDLAASTTAAGFIELATTAEADTGTSTTRAVTPDALKDSVHAVNAANVTTALDTNLTTSGVFTAATVEATGDTASSDNAAMGYTSAEGLILAGQGSTNDFTFKNDIDEDVIAVLTGTQVVRFADAYNFPEVDGSAGQHLQTDGADTVTWETPSGGSSDPLAGDSIIAQRIFVGRG